MIVIVCGVQHGIGVEKDAAEAVRWYRLGADQGHATSQYSLGYCYRVHSDVYVYLQLLSVTLVLRCL